MLHRLFPLLAALPLTACMTFNVGPATDGKHAELRCAASSSGECHFWIYAPDGQSKTEYVLAVNTTRLVDIPATDVKMCTFTTDVESLLCGTPQAYLTAQGYWRIVVPG